MKRVQFSLAANRPARLGWPAANRINAEDARASTPRRAARARRARRAAATAEREAEDDEQRQRDIPLSRSRTTEPNAIVVEPTFFAQRATRTTSPPMVDGSTLPTNWPAK